MSRRLLHIAIALVLLLWTVSARATIQPINGLTVYSLPDQGTQNNGQTINAAGESYGIVGRVRIQDAGTSKTISSSGGEIAWNPGAVTWATSGSKIRIGIQDIDGTTGLEDGTFDTYRELTQGTDTLTASVYRVDPMGSGTKTLSDGDLIAIVVEMTVRNGADSVQVQGTLPPVGISNANAAFQLPYGSIDIGTLSKSSTNALYALIKFDDGTYGAIAGVAVARINSPSVFASFNSTTTPDEYIGTFTPNVKMQVCGISSSIAGVASTDNFEAIFYSDPLGTPSADVTVTADPDVISGAATGGMVLYRITPQTLTVGTVYGVAIRPTTANSLSYQYVDLGSSGIAAYVKGLVPLKSVTLASRTNQTGAFTEVSADDMPLFGVDVCGLDDGMGGGGSFPFALLQQRPH